MMKLFAQGIDQNVGLVMNSVDDLSDQIAGSLNDGLDAAAIDVSGSMTTGSASGIGGVNMGGVTFQIYGAPGQDERVIAQRVSEILNRQVINTRAVFA